jgi:hypothetical protein
MNLYSVTIKNRLGLKFGKRKVNITKNEQEGMRYSVLPGQDVQVSRMEDRYLLSNIKLEVEEPRVGIPIPLTIESPGDYKITLRQMDTKNRCIWVISFDTPGETEGEIPGQVSDDPPVNITVGQEEPRRRFGTFASLLKAFRYVRTLL